MYIHKEDLSLYKRIYLYNRLDVCTRGYISILKPLGCQIYAFVVFVWFYKDLLIYNVRYRCFRVVSL